jgi:hypothetical protein
MKLRANGNPRFLSGITSAARRFADGRGLVEAEPPKYDESPQHDRGFFVAHWLEANSTMGRVAVILRQRLAADFAAEPEQARLGRTLHVRAFSTSLA